MQNLKRIFYLARHPADSRTSLSAWLSVFSYANFTALVVWLGLLFGVSGTVQSAEHEAWLDIKPQTCVSVHQGQMCYVQLIIHWQAGQSGEYCLFSSNQVTALQCWQSASQGNFVQDIATAESLQFSLKKGQAMTIAEAELKVSWVYTKKQKSSLSWRLF
ncbi:MAG: DUF3019 domain-containing protein [Paraglaciecola sp.]|nr:DUF3019 domain-containing protein [Paraglaciecola sp.]NCT47941.1 DUF3019 domain-containing protein [Paraglaciecola sp.]